MFGGCVRETLREWLPLFGFEERLRPVMEARDARLDDGAGTSGVTGSKTGLALEFDTEFSKTGWSRLESLSVWLVTM